MKIRAAQMFMGRLAGLVFLLAGCGGTVPSDSPWAFPTGDTGIPVTPYDNLKDGSVAPGDGSIPDETDAAIAGPDAAAPADASTAADGSVTSPDGGGTIDAGPRECPPDEFNSARTAADLPLDGKLEGNISGDCDTAAHALILAKGQSVHIELYGKALIPDLRIYGPGVRGMQLQNRKYLTGVLAIADFTADLPGEYFVYVAQSGRRGASPYTLSSKCKDLCNLRTTRFPTILAHGFSGFKDILSFEYFYKVVDTLAPDGYDLHVAVVDPYNSVENRGPQLAKIIDEVLAKTYARKVNIIGHSQGGLDSRFAITGLGYAGKVGMLNTIATPHHGTPIADLALKEPAVMALFKAFFAAVGIVIETDDQQHALEESLKSMTTEGMVEWNRRYPPDPRVRYRSWTGRTCGLFGSCKKPADIEMQPTWKVVYDVAGDNDGLVPVTSGTWEGFQGLMEADHIDEVGHLLGITGSFDHLAFYRHVVESMADEGF